MASLMTLLEKLNELDEKEYSTEDYDTVIDDIRLKVDSIKEFISFQESEIERLKNDYIKPISARKKQMENSVDNLKKWVVDQLEKNGLHTLKGDIFTLKISERDALDCDDLDITNLFYINNKDIVRKKYEIDKKTLLEKLKEGKTYEFAKLKKSKSVRFTVNKGK